MATDFVNVPVPVTGIGPAVSVANLGPLKTVICGGDFELSIGGVLVVEGGINGSFAPIVRFDREANFDVDSLVLQEVRVVTLGVITGIATIDVGGEVSA